MKKKFVISLHTWHTEGREVTTRKEKHTTNKSVIESIHFIIDT